DLRGERVLLMHGDSLCIDDIGYMRMRRWLRNPLSLFILRHLPLTARHRIGRKLRNESQTRTRYKALEITDGNQDRSEERRGVQTCALPISTCVASACC